MSSHGAEDPAFPALPERAVDRLTRPFVRFLHIESAGGIALILCTAIALVAANTGLAEGYDAFWNNIFHIGVGEYALAYPLWYWVNDALMAIFFFVIGLEIKRELVHGELREPRNLILPVGTAIGGAAVPALIYVALQGSGEAAKGWAIPMATDIAFVVGCLAILGNRIPHGLKVLMLSLAIVDDIIAVLIIAFFYSGGVKAMWLIAAAGGFGLVFAANRIGIRTVTIYLIIGAGIWLCVLKSGVHPTVAGAMLGLITPAAAFVGNKSLLELLAQGRDQVLGKDGSVLTADLIGRVRFLAKEAVSPLERLELALHPWVAFVIMPIFALANAAVEIRLDVISSGISLAIAAALVVGKPVGIVAAALILYRLRLSRLPTGVTWPALTGASCLAGIGFTMSLFIGGLSFQGLQLDAAKTGILLGSLVSAILGMTLLILTTKKPASTAG